MRNHQDIRVADVEKLVIKEILKEYKLDFKKI